MSVSEPTTNTVLSLEELQTSGMVRSGRKHVLSILVENKSGVLTRIAGLFARRGFNIDTLTVGPTDHEEISRVTLTVDGAVHPIDQVTKQLHKLINVLKIRDLEPNATVSRELALFKISADGTQRGELMQIPRSSAAASWTSRNARSSSRSRAQPRRSRLLRTWFVRLG